MNTKSLQQIATWLYVCVCIIILMVLVGGITRLTNSGLSIVEWKPISGIIPPLNDADWAAEFTKYQSSSQYKLANMGMAMAQFKQIFFWEYIHRVLGRVLGFVYALPFLYFLFKRQLPLRLFPRLLLLLILGGAQGAIGWIMVQSGLVDRTSVEPVNLAAHLSMALVLLSVMLWTALDVQYLARLRAQTPSTTSKYQGLFAALEIILTMVLSYAFKGMKLLAARHGLQLFREKQHKLARASKLGLMVWGLLMVQIIYGALMAGMRAGQVSNTWPLMGGSFFPHGVDASKGMIGDPFLVHFIHRWYAWGVFLALMILARRVKALRRRDASIAIHITIGLQILLGIATILSNVWLPLAALHQLNGALCVAACVWAAHIWGRRNNSAVANLR
jgi:heme a synthase